MLFAFCSPKIVFFFRLKSGVEYSKLIEFNNVTDILDINIFVNSGSSFIYIMLPRFFDYIEQFLYSRRDFDILAESLGKKKLILTQKKTICLQSYERWTMLILRWYFLGTLPSQYMLHAKHFISDRTMVKVDLITSSMTENGLYKF